MDDAQFDALARRLTADFPRRGILALLGGSGLGMFLGETRWRVDARTRNSRDRRQRSGAQRKIDGPIAGLPPGTTFNRGCRLAGQRCGFLRVPKGKKRKFVECCGENVACRRYTADGSTVSIGRKERGSCLCDLCYDDADADGICTLTPITPCVGLNGACSASDVCCDEGAGIILNGGGVGVGSVCSGRVFFPPASIACAVVDSLKGGTRCDTVPNPVQCCKLEAMPCTGHCQCCGAMRCQGGFCVGCHDIGAACGDGKPCCAGAGTCLQGRCCLSAGTACPNTCATEAECSACCAGYCRSDGTCGPPQGCQLYGQVCMTNADCCDEVPCIGSDAGGQRRCRYP